eukprot:GHVT01018951.1.p1 GENE.GHVT01018951.1~~GHVT01018951.1.p1  ORF type:complete len:146 (-),score=12.99 GHVT01018951.1:594-1031(-)
MSVRPRGLFYREGKAGGTGKAGWRSRPPSAKRGYGAHQWKYPPLLPTDIQQQLGQHTPAISAKSVRPNTRRTEGIAEGNGRNQAMQMKAHKQKGTSDNRRLQLQILRRMTKSAARKNHRRAHALASSRPAGRQDNYEKPNRFQKE